MKTLQECKDEIAKTEGYISWEYIESYVKRGNYSIEAYVELLNRSTKLYASQFKASEPIEKEQDQWDDVLQITGIYYSSSIARNKVIKELSEKYLITRKQTDSGR
jgi:hypothetical protein